MATRPQPDKCEKVALHVDRATGPCSVPQHVVRWSWPYKAGAAASHAEVLVMLTVTSTYSKLSPKHREDGQSTPAHHTDQAGTSLDTGKNTVSEIYLFNDRGQQWRSGDRDRLLKLRRQSLAGWPTAADLLNLQVKSRHTTEITNMLLEQFYSPKVEIKWVMDKTRRRIPHRMSFPLPIATMRRIGADNVDTKVTSTTLVVTEKKGKAFVKCCAIVRQTRQIKKDHGVTPPTPAVDATRTTSLEAHRVAAVALSSVSVLCGQHLQGLCSQAHCQLRHSPHALPYHWQWAGNRQGHQLADAVWNDFKLKENVEIEGCFCDVSKEVLCTKIEGTGLVSPPIRQVQLSFEKMTFQHWDGKIGFIRRLEVATTDREINNPKSHRTVWQWHWQDDDGEWHSYESKAIVASSLRTGVQPKGALITGYIFSDDIERAFIKTPHSGVTYTHQLLNHKYSIDFPRRIQINRSTGKHRAVRRRPACFRSTSLMMTPNRTVEIRYPGTWDLGVGNAEFHYDLITVTREGPTADEYREIERLFNATMKGVAVIKSIRRLQNRSLWDRFHMFKVTLAKKGAGDKRIDVRRLFHGTRKQYIDAISMDGFDWRVSGTSTGARFGSGSYFARDAVYSKDYTDCQTMFIAQVIVGEFAQGGPKMVRPPPKDPHKPHHNLYDSCVDNVSNPKIFVTFEAAQSYPEYILEYQ